MRSNTFRLILRAGIIAGTLDIIAAIIMSSVVRKTATAEKVLQSVASGLIGKGSYQGGIATAALGLLLHFMIAIIFAAA